MSEVIERCWDLARALPTSIMQAVIHERTEGVKGAERLLVPPTRSGKGQGDAEQRSAEGCAVPPGEAEAAFPETLKYALTSAALHEQSHVMFLAMKGRSAEAASHKLRAAIHREYAQRLARELPKPDSDADNSCPAPPREASEE